MSALLKEASEILDRSGKQSALKGDQQRSRKRVWEIAAAIWAAVAQRRIAYIEPPASFERDGQKIRRPSEVIETGLATCLDSPSPTKSYALGKLPGCWAEGPAASGARSP